MANHIDDAKRELKTDITNLTVTVEKELEGVRADVEDFARAALRASRVSLTASLITLTLLVIWIVLRGLQVVK